MILLKNYFVTTSQEVDVIPILPDIRLTIQEAQIPEGLVTITIPVEEANFWIAKEIPKEKLKETKNWDGLNNRSLSLPFKNGDLTLAPKQMIYLVDQSHSGKRREFYVQVLGEKGEAAGARPGARRRR